MNKNYILIAIFLLPLMMVSQINGVTEFGDEVILYDNGTWKFIGEKTENTEEISTNETIYTKDEKSKFLLKSSTLNVGVWLNPKKWKFTKAVNNDEGEYELILKGEDLYGTIITEKVQIPLEALKHIALENAQSVAPDTVISKQEYRTVNGLKVLMLELNGTMSGINFIYNGYYYSNENGTIQMILYTAKNLVKSYEKDIEILLNGFVEIK